jgi:hypothetical protein
MPAGQRLPRLRCKKVFNLDEGQVTLTFPSAQSSESHEDFVCAHLELFLRKAKRRAAAEKTAKDFERRMDGDPEE